MGSLFSKQWNPYSDMPDLTGRVAVVTGGNAGLGYQTVAHLSRAGAKVYVAARSEEKAKKAIEELHAANSEIKDGNLVWLPLDLSDIRSILEAARIVRTQEKRLDLLINNAGLVATTFETTDAGFESTMGICHIGHFVLTEELLPLLKSTAASPGSDVRIITLGSNAHKIFVAPDVDIDFSSKTCLVAKGTGDAGQEDKFLVNMRRYGLAKLANTLFATELQRRLDVEYAALLAAEGAARDASTTTAVVSPIISISLHPGGVATDGAVRLFGFLPAAVVRGAMMTPDKGAWTTLFAATSAAVRADRDRYAGRYLEPFGHVAEPHRIARAAMRSLVLENPLPRPATVAKDGAETARRSGGGGGVAKPATFSPAWDGKVDYATLADNGEGAAGGGLFGDWFTFHAGTRDVGVAQAATATHDNADYVTAARDLWQTTDAAVSAYRKTNGLGLAAAS